MPRLLKPLKKLPDLFQQIKINLDKNKYDSVNLYFQDESRFGLKTHIGKCLTAKGVKPIGIYQHAFKNTYLFGSFSPINGESFVWEINGVDKRIFEEYLNEFAKQDPKELKIIVIDNAGFHSTKDMNLPENIKLVRIPPYSPELNPCEKVWHFIKQKYKNQFFANLDNLRQWLVETIRKHLKKDRIKSITKNQLYLDAFVAHFDV